MWAAKRTGSFEPRIFKKKTIGSASDDRRCASITLNGSWTRKAKALSFCRTISQ